mgnify:FL=1
MPTWDQLPAVLSAIGTVVAVTITLFLGLRKDIAEKRTADDLVGDRLRDDLLEMFEAQNKRLKEQDDKLTKQQDIIDKLQELIDSLRESNRGLQTQKHELELQNLNLLAKLEQWEKLRRTVVSVQNDDNGKE